MEAPQQPQDSETLNLLYESLENVKTVEDRLSIQLQIIDLHAESGDCEKEKIKEALNELEYFAMQEGLDELVTRIEKVRKEIL